MRVTKLAVNSKKVFAVFLAGTMVFVTGVKKPNRVSESTNRGSLPFYEQQKENDLNQCDEMDPAILPEEPNYEVVLEKKKRRKNGKWVA